MKTTILSKNHPSLTLKWMKRMATTGFAAFLDFFAR